MRTSFKIESQYGEQTVACGSIDPLPGSSQVAVFHSAFVLPEHRNSNLGYAAHVDRIKKAEDALYDYAVVTVNSTNEAQVRILRRAGWTVIASFISRKTGHDVQMWGRHI